MSAPKRTGSYWNNRIMVHPDGTFGLHEVFYEEDKPAGWTEYSLVGQFETVEDLVETLEQMHSDAIRYKDRILRYDMKPGKSRIDLTDLVQFDPKPKKKGRRSGGAGFSSSPPV